MIIRSRDIDGLIEKLSGPLNHWLHEGGRRIVSPDSLDQVVNELRRSQFNLTRGVDEYRLNLEGVEIVAVSSPGKYASYVAEIVDFYVNIMTTLRQIREIVSKLELEEEFTLIIGDGVDVVVGPNIGDSSFLLNLPEPYVRVEFPSGLSVITGLSGEERRNVERLIDEVINGGDIVVESRIALEDHGFPVVAHEG
jgi:hypothetical protein